MERSRVGGKRAGPTASTRGVYKLCQCFCFVCVCVSVCLCVCLSLFCLCLFFSLSSSNRLLAVPLSLFRIYRQSHRWPSALKRSTPNPISQGVCVCVSVCVCVCVLAILFGIDAALTSNAQPPPPTALSLVCWMCATSNLHPVFERFKAKTSLRCRVCQHNVMRPELGPDSSKFKIAQFAR